MAEAPGDAPGAARYIGFFLVRLVLRVVVVGELSGVCVVIVESVAVELGLAIGSGMVVAGSLDGVVGVVGIVVAGAVGELPGVDGVVPGVLGPPGAGAVWASAALESVSAAMPARVAIRMGFILLQLREGTHVGLVGRTLCRSI